MKKIILDQDLNTILRKKNSFLDRADMRVFTSASTEEVLQIHRTVRADLIMINLDMPGMGIEQLCFLLRESAEHSPVSIILVCANTESAVQQSSHCNVEAVIIRPFKPAQLLAQAKTLLNVSWRETYRVLLNVAVEGTVNAKHFVCTSLDISLAGMLIETTQTFNQGDRLSCSFFLPNMAQIQLTGEIVRTVRTVPGVVANWYGVHFLNLSPDAATTLKAFIDANASKSPAGRGVQPA
jgi:DNA-binding response OmpR family regulator